MEGWMMRWKAECRDGRMDDEMENWKMRWKTG